MLVLDFVTDMRAKLGLYEFNRMRFLALVYCFYSGKIPRIINLYIGRA